MTLFFNFQSQAPQTFAVSLAYVATVVNDVREMCTQVMENIDCMLILSMADTMVC